MVLMIISLTSWLFEEEYIVTRVQENQLKAKMGNGLLGKLRPAVSSGEIVEYLLFAPLFICINQRIFEFKVIVPNDC